MANVPNRWGRGLNSWKSVGNDTRLCTGVAAGSIFRDEIEIVNITAWLTEP